MNNSKTTKTEYCDRSSKKFSSNLLGFLFSFSFVDGKLQKIFDVENDVFFARDRDGIVRVEILVARDRDEIVRVEIFVVGDREKANVVVDVEVVILVQLVDDRTVVAIVIVAQMIEKSGNTGSVQL